MNRDPDVITELLHCAPTRAERKGVPVFGRDGSERIPKRGYWAVELSSPQSGDWDVEEVIKGMLAKLPADAELWAELNRTCKVDLYCGLFMEAANRGFSLSPSTCQMLADRHLEIGFDIYAPPL